MPIKNKFSKLVQHELVVGAKKKLQDQLVVFEKAVEDRKHLLSGSEQTNRFRLARRAVREQAERVATTFLSHFPISVTTQKT